MGRGAAMKQQEHGTAPGDLDVPVEPACMDGPAVFTIWPVARIPFQFDLRRPPFCRRGLGEGRGAGSRGPRAACDCRVIVRTTPDICSASACGNGR